MRCYCCGKELGAEFVLVTYGEDADRGFLMTKECATRVSGVWVNQVKFTGRTRNA